MEPPHTTNEIRDIRERVLRVEMEISAQNKQMEKLIQQTGEVHDLLLQVKGAKWLVLVLAAIIGFVASKAAAIINLIGGPIR